MERYYYIETDGMVYLVEEGGRLRFPRTTEGLGFEVEVKWPMVVAGKEVLFSKPRIDYYPEDWWPKDEIPSLDRADPLVRQAVHLSLPRIVAEGVIVEEGKILLVKASRGFLKDQWNLPGGFVGYGESPPEAVAREVAEEVGAPCRVGRLLGVESFIGKKSCLHWHMFFYEVELAGREFHPAADEILEVRWFPIAQAVELLGDRVMSRKIRELFA
ncbi:MAG: NUDIX hydrolase [Candidatus Acetothermia bacterium]|jgi:8-oxo-dGTP diphosphatase|nr:NUDIX hydrolase [Candidatus Acetothermia bacterium]MDH7505761.1 NUDIX hydrolase [Candidatus Acetothermia bacterium]